MDAVPISSTSPQHWAWAEDSNAIAEPLYHGKETLVIQVPVDKVSKVWSQYVPLLRAIEGLPSSVLSTGVEMLVRYNVAVALLSWNENSDRSPCHIPVNGPAHIALHLLSHGLERAFAAMSTGDDVDWMALRKGRNVGSLDVANPRAVQEEEVEEVMILAKSTVEKLSSAKEEAACCALPLTMCFSLISQCLDALSFERCSRELLVLCGEMLASRQAVSTAPGTEGPDTILLGFPGGIRRFSEVSELRSTLLDSVCANLITHIESREDVFSFSAVYAKCASSERASSRYLISFLKAWILCSGKEYEQCLALLDAVKEPWPDTLHPSVELMCGICHFHLCQLHQALLRFKTTIAMNEIPSSLLALHLSCCVFRRLGQRKSELKAWRLLMKLYDEYRRQKGICCWLAAVTPSIVAGDSAQFCEMTDGAVVSGDTDGGRLLPPLSVHCHLHHVSVHFAVPQRLQLLQDYARCLFSQHNSQDIVSDCTAASTNLLKALVTSSSQLCGEVFSLQSAAGSDGPVALLEFAAALQATDHPEDCISVCGKLLDYCARLSGVNPLHETVAIKHGSALTIKARGHVDDVSSVSSAATFPSRKRKHGSPFVTSQVNGPFLNFVEAAAWLCRSLNLEKTNCLEAAISGYKSCITTLESWTSDDMQLQMDTKYASRLSTLKGQALYHLAKLLHSNPSYDDHTIEEYLQQAINCCSVGGHA